MLSNNVYTKKFEVFWKNLTNFAKQKLVLIKLIATTYSNFDNLGTKQTKRTEKKIEYHYQIPHIAISRDTQFHLKKRILNFYIKFSQKGHFSSKTKEPNTITKFWIFQLIDKPNLNSNWQFSCLGPNLPKKSIFGQHPKNVHRHWYHYIGINQDSKLQLKQAILSFWRTLARKEYF